jgi:recombination protein RecA
MSKKLDHLLKSLEKNYTVKKASELKPADKKIKTGIYALDYVLSGGITDCMGGHRLEFFGAESSGKTTFALYIIKKFQEEGKTCVFVDGENSYDTDWAEIIGIDNEKLIVVQPSSLEEAGDILDKVTKEADLIVVDSIVSLIPEEEIDRDTNEPTMALQARVNSRITRQLYKQLLDTKITMIFINQLREKVGQLYGNPHTTGGGRALRHFYNTRIEFRAGKPIDVGSGDKKERIGIEINLKAVKNKKGVPYKQAVVDFYFSNGTIDNKKSLFYSAIKYGVIQLSGKTYSYGKLKVVGKDNFLEKFDKWDELEDKIWEIQK